MNGETWESNGYESTTLIMLGTWTFVDKWGATETVIFPAATLVGMTLNAYVGVIDANEVVSDSRPADSMSATEATATSEELANISYNGKKPKSAGLLGQITAKWLPATITSGVKREQVEIVIPGDKPYTITDHDVIVNPSLG